MHGSRRCARALTCAPSLDVSRPGEAGAKPGPGSPRSMRSLSRSRGPTRRRFMPLCAVPSRAWPAWDPTATLPSRTMPTGLT
eukprot:5386899-Alexandrium_andersonii.AAC.1